MQVTRWGRSTRRALRDLIGQWGIELVHTNTAATDAGACIAAELRIPHVWHVRERIGREGFMHFRPSDRDLTARIAGLSSAIVPMSRFVGEIFGRHGHGAKTQVVYDGVDLDQFGSPAAGKRGRDLRRVWGIPEGSLLIAKVADVTTQVKRHDVFIRAAGLLGRSDPSLRFAIIGPLPRLTSWARRQGIEYYQRLHEMVREEGLEERFLWTGEVGDIAGMMHAVDVLAHACDLEGFGRVAIEAMAASKPVVGPAAGGFAESVVDGETGRLVRPGDPGELARALAELVGDPVLRERYGRAGRERAAREFSSERHLERMMEVYKSVL
jgi:glycosyltransferase involved in cell wall biosynthesis